MFSRNASTLSFFDHELVSSVLSSLEKVKAAIVGTILRASIVEMNDTTVTFSSVSATDNLVISTSGTLDKFSWAIELTVILLSRIVV